MINIKSGLRCKVVSTENTNEIAERLGFNISNRDAVIIDTFIGADFGDISVRVQADKKNWTDVIILKIEDIQEK